MAARTLGAADQKLLALLVRAGKVDAQQAASVDQLPGDGVIERLDRAHIVSEQDVASLLAGRLQLPIVPPSMTALDEAALLLLDEPTAKQCTLIPIRVEKGSLTIAMANPLDHDAIRRVEFFSGLPTRVSVAPRSEIVQAIDARYGHERALATMLADIPPAEDIEVVGRAAPDTSAEVDTLVREAEQAPVVKMVNLILTEALRARASDIHVEPGRTVVNVRYRINGVLEPALEIPKWLQGPVVARLKVMAKLDIAERRMPQDGRIAMRREAHLVDMRVSSLPTSDGETVVIRILDTSRSPWDMEAIGLSERDLAVLHRVMRRPQGMILVTGPTGSGKTTTLYAVLKALNSPDRKIVTIENPIEYKLPGVSQVEVNEKQGLTFGTALRSVLRQDPDVILVGEIRDRETAEVAFRAAQTGHLVLSTLHTNDTAATVTRLADLGVEPFVIASALMAVVAQRLVRTLCERCAEPATIAEDLRRRLGLADVTRLRHGNGCSGCRSTGFAARTGCYEVMEVTKAIRDLVSSQRTESSIRATAEEQGMRSVQADAIDKLVAGRTTAAEVLRVIEVEAERSSCPQCANPVEEAFSVCPMCGTSLRCQCASCGKTLKEEWSRCPYCSTSVAKASRAPSRDSVRVLVVDDHADIRHLVRRVLQREPIEMEIDEAANGREALAKVEAQRPNLIIVDMMMPEMDGAEFCRRLRASLSTAVIPILMLTARNDPEGKSLGYLAGVDDYVVKPFEPDRLRTRVRWLLEGAYERNGEQKPA